MILGLDCLSLLNYTIRCGDKTTRKENLIACNAATSQSSKFLVENGCDEESGDDDLNKMLSRY